MEASPAEFVQAMVAVFREVKRVLHPSGVCWINIGDSYYNDSRGDIRPSGNLGKDGRYNGSTRVDDLPGLKPKDLLGIPWAVAFALRDDGWWLRSELIWAKPNPMPESVTDRPTKSHEQVFLLSKSERYFYDAEAVREEANSFGRQHTTGVQPPKVQTYADGTGQHGQNGDLSINYERSSRNMRSVLTIPSESYPGSHYATYPRKLIEPLIKAGSSEQGCCPRCRAPWERVVEATEEYQRFTDEEKSRRGSMKSNDLESLGLSRGKANRSVTRSTNTLGWRPTCQHTDEPRPCVVLDPFCGSGTSIIVAQALGRDAIGVDLSHEYLTRDARRRIDRPHSKPIRPAREEVHPLFDRPSP